MHYCRPATEKFLFSKLYDKLFSMYAIKNEAKDKLFIEKSYLLKQIKPEIIMRNLEVMDLDNLSD
jgi:hypothetical protein